MALTWALTVLTTGFEGTEGKFCGFRHTFKKTETPMLHTRFYFVHFVFITTFQAIQGNL